MSLPENELSAFENAISERLLIEAAQRDPRQFAELYEANFHRVYAYIARRVRDRGAEDLTAEVFKRALINLPRFEWRGVPFAAWLLRIAANAIADQAHELTHVVQADELIDEMVDTETQTAEADLERAVMLGKLVDSLPRDQKLVLVRRFIEQRSIREVAGELGRSEGAIKQLQVRALRTLREKLEAKHA
jgi:RNA polymerase sigma-70 factor (ECF subfamily)